jgi:hypothetical protein
MEMQKLDGIYRRRPPRSHDGMAISITGVQFVFFTNPILDASMKLTDESVNLLGASRHSYLQLSPSSSC